MEEKNITIEEVIQEQINKAIKENEQLKQQLEITQAVLDELLFGGAK